MDRAELDGDAFVRRLLERHQADLDDAGPEDAPETSRPMGPDPLADIPQARVHRVVPRTGPVWPPGSDRIWRKAGTPTLFPPRVTLYRGPAPPR